MKKRDPLALSKDSPVPSVAAVDVRPETGDWCPLTITIGDQVFAGTLTGIRLPRKEDNEK